MNSTELRIGNKIYYDGHIVDIITLWANGSFEVHSDILQFWHVDKDEELATGILLTPEILRQFGFQETDKFWNREGDVNYVAFEIGSFVIAIVDEKYRMWIDIDEDKFYSFPWTEIQFIHDLQNLYKSLYKQELNFNLTQTA